MANMQVMASYCSSSRHSCCPSSGVSSKSAAMSAPTGKPTMVMLGSGKCQTNNLEPAGLAGLYKTCTYKEKDCKTAASGADAACCNTHFKCSFETVSETMAAGWRLLSSVSQSRSTQIFTWHAGYCVIVCVLNDAGLDHCDKCADLD